MHPSKPSAEVKVKHAARHNSAPSGYKSLEDEYRLQYNSTNPSKSMPKTSVRSMPTSPESTEEVAAYVLQPDGTMAAVRWDDKSALERNRTVLEALKEEQQARQRGHSSGKVRNVNNTGAALQTDVLHWLTADETNSSPAVARQLPNSQRDKIDMQWKNRQRETTAGQAPAPYAPSLQTQVGLTHSPMTPSRNSRNSLKILRVSDSLNRLTANQPLTGRAHSTTSTHSSSSPPATRQATMHQLHSGKLQTSMERSPGPTASKKSSESSGSAQVQESLWSPQLNTQGRQPATHYALPSTQQRQLSIEKADSQHFKSPTPVRNLKASEETSVWESFRFDERCAVTDF